MWFRGLGGVRSLQGLGIRGLKPAKALIKPAA